MASARRASASDSRLSVTPCAIASASSSSRLPGPAKLVSLGSCPAARTISSSPPEAMSKPSVRVSHQFEDRLVRICFYGIMYLELRRHRRPQLGHAAPDQLGRIDEQRGVRRRASTSALAGARRSPARRRSPRSRAGSVRAASCRPAPPASAARSILPFGIGRHRVDPADRPAAA